MITAANAMARNEGMHATVSKQQPTLSRNGRRLFSNNNHGHSLSRDKDRSSFYEEERGEGSLIERNKICKELHGIENALNLCYEELTRSGLKNMLDLNAQKSLNTDQVVGLQELFQRLVGEMDHLRTMLSHINENNVDQSSTTVRNNQPVINDFIYMNGPLTENMVVSTLEGRFKAQKYCINIGPVLVAVNPFGLSETEHDLEQEASNNQLLKQFLTQALYHFYNTQTSQMVILSGESCAGKSFTAHVSIYQLLHITSGGLQTDLAKQLVSSMTVLRSFSKAKTINNADSSRVATLFEFHFVDQILSKVKIQCFPLDMSRILRTRNGQRSFHIFYQLFAGLCPNDRAKLQLQTHSAHELRYLYNYPATNQAEIEVLRNQFQLWKNALSVLGIPFADVSRVLAAILLLGNVHFMEKSANILDVQGGDFEFKSVALLLGVPYTSLFRSLTKRTKLIKGEIVVQSCPASQANSSRDALAKSLYSRTLCAIIRRCNSSRKPVYTDGTSPNGSNDSLSKNNPNLSTVQQDDLNIASSDCQLVDKNLAKIFGVADLFGFEHAESNSMEQICCNLCSETIQNFYTAHIFKSAVRYCREEDIDNEVNVGYIDNSSCIELLTCQPNGVLPVLDRECLDVSFGTVESFMENVQDKHSDHARFGSSNSDKFEFTIAHHVDKVVYDVKDLFLSNDDSIVDDVIRIFSKQNCHFGFVAHLFTNDLKTTLSRQVSDGEDFLHKISQNNNLDKAGLQTLSQDFQGQLDGLLEQIVEAQPWFILCIKSNSAQHRGVFDRNVVSKQVKSLQIFETIYLLKSGYTRRMRILPFAQRYFAFQDDRLTEEDAFDIVRGYQSLIAKERIDNPNKMFFVGKKYVLLSEVVWQNLERDRREKEADYLRRSTPVQEETISPPKRELRYEENPIILVEEARDKQLNSDEIDTSTPPPIPKRRSYAVINNKKVKFPQTRVMIHNYRDFQHGKEVVFSSGEVINVVGASPKSAFLNVETKNKTGCVPYKLTSLLSDNG